MYKRPESVLIIVYTPQSEFLLLCRKQPEQYWQSVTGSLQADESLTAAAQRELQEETGIWAGADLLNTGKINCYSIHPAWRHRFAPEVKRNTEYVFQLLLPQRCEVILNPKEHIGYGWFTAEQAVAMTASETNRAAIQALSATQ